ncbi:hypothetical protein LrDSM24759_07040 [Lactobacillus rodentium]|uniref:Uncharacterized protein n=1 Tax=Lactobacillus rodentium TaxID=947835 RepID=A0A2Z6TEZ1_9LACO|nr:hypothetical protein LrDSM24759_07040 [Lactobacillus rodentium]
MNFFDNLHFGNYLILLGIIICTSLLASIIFWLKFRRNIKK